MDFTLQEEGSSYVKLQDVQLDKNAEIHYIQCDDNELPLADNCQIGLTNVCIGSSKQWVPANLFLTLFQLILEDGTTAMLLDGTLLTSDGETIILQDDDGNLSHFMIDHKTGLCNFMKVRSE